MIDKDEMTNDTTIVKDIIDIFQMMMRMPLGEYDDYINAFITLSKDSDIEKLKELIGSQLKIKISSKENTMLMTFNICDILYDSSNPVIILTICLSEDVSLSDILTTLDQFDKLTHFNTDLIDNSNIISISFNTFINCMHQAIKITDINTGKYNFEKGQIYLDDTIDMGRGYRPMMELLRKMPEFKEIMHKYFKEPKSSVLIMENMKDRYFDTLLSNTPFDEDLNGYHPKCTHRLNGKFTLNENSDGTYTCTQCGAILKFIED
jgi:hypothetical protein